VEVDEESSLLPLREPSLVATSLSVLGIGVGLFLLLGMIADLSFFLSSTVPIDLGTPSDYHAERARDGIYARLGDIHGKLVGHFERFEWNDFTKRQWDVVVATGTDIVLRRASGAPVSEPFAAEGRLIRDDHAPEYSDAFQLSVLRGGLEPKGHAFILLDGSRPRHGWTTPVISIVLAVFVVVNGLALVRAFGRRSRARLEDIET
jgi:hypothetical protein